jgi:DNA-binding transcriptional MocR family regulator
VAPPHPPRSRRGLAPRAGTALWTLLLLDQASAKPLSKQLAAALRQALANRSFKAGARLPSTRCLATELGIARGTVVAVFEQLAAEGYIEPRQGSAFSLPAANPGGLLQELTARSTHGARYLGLC